MALQQSDGEVKVVVEEDMVGGENLVLEREIERDPEAEAVAKVVAFWEEFHLDGRRLKLDQQGLEMASNKDKSVRSRKKLAEETREFKKISEAEVRSKRIGALLRAYQEEVDKLTRRSRFAESAFLALYKALYEAPDPVQHLRRGAEQGTASRKLQYELAKVKAELEEYEREFSELKNQDITIRELQDTIERLSSEAVSREAIEEREKAIEERVEEVRAQESERMMTMEARVEELGKQNAEFQRMYDEAQEELFELRSAMEEQEAAQDAEIEIAEEDQSRKKSLDIQIQQLRTQLEQTSNQTNANRTHSLPHTDSSSADRARVLQLEDELIEKRKANVVLEEEAAQLRGEMRVLRSARNRALEESERKLELAKGELKTLKEELEGLPSKKDFEAVQHQLKLFQALEFNVDTTNAEIETAAFQKVRKLEATITKQKVELSECRLELEEVLQQNEEFRERRSDDALLIKKLEEELASMNNKRGGEEKTLSNNVREQITETNILKSALSRSNGDQMLGEDSSMLTIVHEQRNRFRQRMLELEAERDRLNGQVTRLKQEMQTLKTDNVKLYEKIKYLQSYATSVDKAGRLNANQMSEMRVTVRNESPIEQRYKELYEDQMNPFADFSHRERRKRYQGLNAVEKITLKASNFFLANRHTRSFLFFYFIALHVLIFLMLVLNTHTGYNKCTRYGHGLADSSKLPPGVVAHAAEAAANGGA